MTLSAFPYPGGKDFHLDEILPYFPKHEVYVEVFGGSAALLLNKPRSDIEVYNDIDEDVVQFFDVVRDRCEELQAWLRSVPFSRTLHERWGQAFYDGYRPSDAIERAGRWFYLRYAQYSGKLDGISGFKYSTARDEASRFQNAVEGLEEVTARFRRVTLENLPYTEVVEKYDSADTLLYFDPPYVGPGDDLYRHEGAFDHGQFVRTLASCEGKWVCSYGELPEGLAEAIESEGWTTREYGITYSMDRGERDESIERLVMNFDPAATPTCSAVGQSTIIESIGD